MEQSNAPENALRLDDNDYPKHLWSFVFRGKEFQKHGPLGYSLAHLADHKHHGNRGKDEFDSKGHVSAPTPLFGLYTSAANTVYLPNGLIRPTDFSFLLRNLLQRRAAQLYGDFCNLLRSPLSIRLIESPEWRLDQFAWADPVGTMDHLPAFLEFRSERMERLFAGFAPLHDVAAE